VLCRRRHKHDLRHSYATAALAANVSPKVVSERLGHAKVGITLDVYSHVLPSMDEQAALTVARLILGEDTPGQGVMADVLWLRRAYP
jgi:Site-specific recombinase XerD